MMPRIVGQLADCQSILSIIDITPTIPVAGQFQSLADSRHQSAFTELPCGYGLHTSGQSTGTGPTFNRLAFSFDWLHKPLHKVQEIQETMPWLVPVSNVPSFLLSFTQGRCLGTNLRVSPTSFIKCCLS